MYIVLLHYLAPLSEVDEALPEHGEFLRKHLADKTFLMAGRLDPRTGGVIIARCESREKLDEILATDPFHRRKLAEYRVIEFRASRTIPELANFVDRS